MVRLHLGHGFISFRFRFLRNPDNGHVDGSEWDRDRHFRTRSADESERSFTGVGLPRSIKGNQLSIEVHRLMPRGVPITFGPGRHPSSSARFLLTPLKWGCLYTPTSGHFQCPSACLKDVRRGSRVPVHQHSASLPPAGRRLKMSGQCYTDALLASRVALL
jgi:hypothetical protein